MLNDLLEAKQLGKAENYYFNPVFSDFKVLLFPLIPLYLIHSFIHWTRLINAYYIAATVWDIK